MSAESKPELSPNFCPYQGLEPYTEAQRAYFFGRERDIKIIISNLHGTPLSVLYGVSGVGKSSVLLAGVAPELRRTEGLAVVVWREWQGDNFAVSLKQAVLDAVSESLRKERRTDVTLPDPSLPFDELLFECNRALDGPIFLIFDQWEEYFLYHPPSPSGNGFETEFARAVNRRDIAANFLLSMREEELSKLDRFRSTIPNLLGNMLRLKHLDHAAAERAIREPLRVFNERVPADRRMTIEDELAQNLIEKSRQDPLAQSGPGQTNPLTPNEQRIETPVLQMLLTRLWQEERNHNSLKLRAATLEELGGAENVVASYFQDVISLLSDEERDTASHTFRFLVTPTGSKQAQMPQTLAEWAKRPLDQVTSLLERLSLQPNTRVLRKVTVAGRPDHYEIFHDVLGPAILAWVQQREQAQAELEARKKAEEQERARQRQQELEQAQKLAEVERQRAEEQQRRVKQFRFGLVALSLLLLGMFALTGIAFQQRASANEQRGLALRARDEVTRQKDEADKAKIEAERQRGEAEKARDDAKLAQAEAEKQKNIAIAQRNIADQAKVEAEQQRSEAVAQRRVAEEAKEEAGRQQKIAFSRELAANSISQSKIDPDLGLLLALEAKRVVYTAQAEDALRQSLLKSPVRAVLRGHTSSLHSAAFSPDGRLVVTASSDKTARVWEAGTGKSLVVLQGHTSEVRSAAFSPDGNLVVTVSRDNTPRVWETSTGKSVAVLRGHTNTPLSAAFSPDGKVIVTTSEDKTARIWEAGTGKNLSVLQGHTGNVLSGLFSPDSRLIVTTSHDETARVWEAGTGKNLVILQAHTSLNSAAFSPDGKLIVTMSSGNTARVWEASTGKSLNVLQGDTGEVMSAAFSPDSKFVVTTADGTARVWEASTGRNLAVLQGYARNIYDAAFSSDNKFILAVSYNIAQVWEAATGKNVTDLRGHTGIVRSAVFSPDNRFVVTASDDGTARVWETGTDESVVQMKTGYVHGLEFSPDCKFIFNTELPSAYEISTGKSVNLMGNSYWFRLWAFSPDSKFVITRYTGITSVVSEVSTGKSVAVLQGDTGNVTGAAFSPDSKLIVTTSSDKTARVLEASTGKSLVILQGHTDEVRSAAFSPDSKFVVTASADRTARVWEAGTGKSVTELHGHTGVVQSAVFNPDGKHVLTAGDDGARIWEAGTGKNVAVLPISDLYTEAVFSPDGRLIVTYGSFQRPRVWDVSTGKKLAELGGFFAGFSPDSRLILTRNGLDTSWVREAYTGKSLAELRGGLSAAFGPDGKFVVTADDYSTVRIYPEVVFLPFDDLLKLASRRVARELTPEEREKYLHEAQSKRQ